MLLRRFSPIRFVCVSACAALIPGFTLCLWGCQRASEVPLSDASSAADAEQQTDNSQGDPAATDAAEAHHHDHPAPSTEVDAPSNVEKGADAEEVAQALKPAAGKPADSGREMKKSAESSQERANEAAIQREPLPTDVMLGDDTLTRGIPGEGPLSVAELKTWLARPDVHKPLSVTLPLGLSLGQQQISGLQENPLTRAKIELGRQLYFDGRLSSDGSISCASCHHPDTGWTAQTQFGVGVGGQTGNRNSPVSFNRIVSGAQFWDGRAASLEEQAIGPIANPIEMGNTHEVAVETVKNNPGYRLQFKRIFGEDAVKTDAVTIDNIGQAIAAFERTVVTGPSAYDYYAALKPFQDQFTEEDLADLKEDSPELYEQYEQAKAASEEHAMSASAIRGLELFFGKKAGCTQCHVGANFTDEKYHNLGVGMDDEDPDLGRYEVTGAEQDKGAFKTPTVRNVEFTAPYMHDGSQKTLEEVVEWYARGGHPNPWLSEKIKKLDLTEQDKQDLVAFMNSLSGPFPAIETARLPE